MDDTKPGSSKELSTQNHDKNKQTAVSAEPSELSGPIMFARADDILFAAAMEDESAFEAEIEIDEKVLNSSSNNNVSETELQKSNPVIEQKEPEKKASVDKDESKIDKEASIDIKNYVSEEIFEFDLSDPITEPTTVIGGEEDSFVEDVSAEEIPPESTSLKKPNILEDSAVIENKLMDEIDLDEPSIIKNEVQLEMTEPVLHIENKNITILEESLPVLNTEQSNPKPSNPKNVDVEESYSPEQEINIEKCLPIEEIIEEEALPIQASTDSSEPVNIDKIKEIVLEGKHLDIEVDVSQENIILINNSQEFVKYQHSIMDNRCISFFWPCDQNGVIGSRISVTTEKEKTFIIDLDKIDINLLNVLLKSQRPIKIFYDAKPIIIWCLKNNLKVNHIFDISTAISILSGGLNADISLKNLIKRYANKDISSDDISFQDFIIIGKFVFMFRKKLVECLQEFNLTQTLNFEQNLLFTIAQSESDGMPYNPQYSNPMPQNVWELVESKYGITSKKELAKTGILFLNKDYLSDKKNLLEVYEYASLESAERTIKNFDSKFIKEGRIYSTLISTPSGSISTKDYSFDKEGLYPFISPGKDDCLVEGEYKNLEVRVVAKLLNNRKLISSFNTEGGPFSYFAAPLFDKASENVTVDEKYQAKMIFDIIIRNLGERETLYYAWNTAKSFLKEEEIMSLKEKFKKVHPDLINLIKDTQKQAKKDGYISSSLGRIMILNNTNKAFFSKVEMYTNEIFKRALGLSFVDFEAYNQEFTNKIKLCTIYDQIITLECNKKIVNIAIDMLTRNMMTAAAKMLRGIPVLLKVYAAEQWEA